MGGMTGPDEPEVTVLDPALTEPLMGEMFDTVDYAVNYPDDTMPPVDPSEDDDDG